MVRKGSAALLGEVGGFGGEKLGSEVACVCVVVCVAALAGSTVLELGVGGEEALVVGWTPEGLFASRLRNC